MNANSDERDSRATDQEAFQNSICNHLSPQAVAMIVAYLQPASSHRPQNDEARRAMREVERFSNTLIELMGVDELNRLMDELCL